MFLLYIYTPDFVLNKWKLRKLETISLQRDTLNRSFKISMEDDKR